MGRIASAKDGNWRGGSGVPIGYRYLPRTATEDGRLVIDPYEAQIVRTVFYLFLRGKTFHAIYDYCRERYTTKYGSFAGGGANLIPAMLSNRAYIGDIKYCGIWYPGKHEPILDVETFNRAQDKLAEYRATLDDHRRKPFEAGHLLTGLLYCGECGARWCYHGCSYTTKSGERRTYGTYACYTKNAHPSQRKADRCSIPVWSSTELEEAVWTQVLALKYTDLQLQETSESAELKTYTERVAAIDRQLARLIDLYAVDTLPIEQIQKRSHDLQGEREKLLQAIDALRRKSSRLSADELQGALEQAQAIHDDGDLQAQRDLFRLLIRRITVLPDRKLTIEWNI